MMPEKTIRKRLYISGLASDVSNQDLKDRFASFGTIMEVDIPRPGAGFGYVELESTQSQLRKCRNVFNQAKWKGNVIKIEDAKMNYTQRLEMEKVERARIERRIEKSQKKRLRQQPVLHAKDMSIVTDETSKEGWKKCRYGRMLPILQIRHPKSHKVLKVDPLKFKLNFKRLDLEASQKSVVELDVIPKVSLGDDAMSIDTETESESDISEETPPPVEIESKEEIKEEEKEETFAHEGAEIEMKDEPQSSVAPLVSDLFPQPVQSNELFDVKENLRSLVFGDSVGGLFSFGSQEQDHSNKPQECDEQLPLEAPVSIDKPSLPANHMLTTLLTLQRHHTHSTSKPAQETGSRSSSNADTSINEPFDIQALKKAPFFFHHMDTHFESEDDKARVWYKSGRVFARDKPEEAIVAEWEAKKADLTKEYKERHKEALRMRRRLHRKRFTR